MNAIRFNFRCSSPLTTLSIIFGCSFWFLGNLISPALAIDRITGAETISKIKIVLGSPEQFADNMKNYTQDFINDNFGSMAIACAFGIAIRMRS